MKLFQNTPASFTVSVRWEVFSVLQSPVFKIVVLQLSVEHPAVVVVNILDEVYRPHEFLAFLHGDLKH